MNVIILYFFSKSSGGRIRQTRDQAGGEGGVSIVLISQVIIHEVKTLIQMINSSWILEKCAFTYSNIYRWIVLPGNENLVLICSHQAIQDEGDFFFSKTVKMIFNWNRGSWWFIKCKSVATGFWELKKNVYQGIYIDIF